jgi:hypothetical protein
MNRPALIAWAKSRNSTGQPASITGPVGKVMAFGHITQEVVLIDPITAIVMGSENDQPTDGRGREWPIFTNFTRTPDDVLPGMVWLEAAIPGTPTLLSLVRRPGNRGVSYSFVLLANGPARPLDREAHRRSAASGGRFSRKAIDATTKRYAADVGLAGVLLAAGLFDDYPGAGHLAAALLEEHIKEDAGLEAALPERAKEQMLALNPAARAAAMGIAKHLLTPR